MPEQNKPFVITDRRKFTPEGEAREGVDLTPASEPTPALEPTLNLVEMPSPAVEPIATDQLADQAEATEPAPGEEDLPPAPTAEQMEASERAFQATAERLDLAIRAANPGADHPPALTFESLVQSIYMQAVVQLGGGTPQGEQPQVDILGARQSIDMLGILLQKTQGNLSKNEDLLLSSAVFELRLGFLEMTQALARSAQQRGPGAPGSGPAPTPGGRPGPSIVR